MRIVADDLTGAADAAVAFCASHESVRIGLGAWPSGGEVMAVDTGTRERSEDAAAEALRAALATELGLPEESVAVVGD